MRNYLLCRHGHRAASSVIHSDVLVIYLECPYHFSMIEQSSLHQFRKQRFDVAWNTLSLSLERQAHRGDLVSRW
jgi:hypothetical protein